MSDNQSEQFEKIYGIFGVRKQPGTEKGVYFSDVKLIEEHLDNLFGWHQGRMKLVLGGSHGVELIAEDWAIRNRVEFERVKPITHVEMIDPFGVRNEKIIQKSTDIHVFWDGEDTQLGRTLRMACKAQRRIVVIPVSYD